MKVTRRSVRLWLIAGACAVVAGLLGALATADRAVHDLSFRLLERKVDTNLVLIAIDAKSLRDMERWPWPRSVHADLLDRLSEQGIETAFVDIDFSARTSANEDARLAEALSEFQGKEIFLPAFVQRLSNAGDAIALSTPLPELAEHAELVAVNVHASKDGAVRYLPAGFEWSGNYYNSLPAALSGHVPKDTVIDYSISPESFPTLSYSDVLRGETANYDLRGKTVLIGATAVELGDILNTPIAKATPGIIVQALAAETERQGGLRYFPKLLFYPLALLICGGLIAFASTRGWRTSLLLLAAVTGATLALSIAMQSFSQTLLPGGSLMVMATISIFTAIFQKMEQISLYRLLLKQSLSRKRALLDSVLETTVDSVLLVGHDGIVKKASFSSEVIFASRSSDLVGQEISSLLPELTCAELTEAHAAEEYVAIAANGDRIPVEVSVSQTRASMGETATLIVRDIRQRKAREDELYFHAYHDALTRLPNRRYLFEHVSKNLSADQPGLVVMLDLDRFKEVNDIYGHPMGDKALTAIAARLKTHITDEIFISRVGGDEFVLVLQGREYFDTVSEVATSILHDIQRPIALSAGDVEFDASIGVARCPDDGVSALDLFRCADMAMYSAKGSDEPIHFYDASTDEHDTRAIELVPALRDAVENDSLILHYQPKVELLSNSFCGVEALTRWQHPEYGPVSPEFFVNIAEQTRLIAPMTYWSIKEGVRQHNEWRKTGLHVPIAINLSPRVLQDDELIGHLETALQDLESADALQVEITETAFMERREKALIAVRQIKDLGISIAIDDFGTGFSSLAYLRDLGADVLKIDRTFVEGMSRKESDLVIVRSTIRMAHELGLKVIAEGVETDWQLLQLRQLGCNQIQGFVYAKPIPGLAIPDWATSFNEENGNPISTEAANADESNILPIISDAG